MVSNQVRPCKSCEVTPTPRVGVSSGRDLPAFADLAGKRDRSYVVTDRLGRLLFGQGSYRGGLEDWWHVTPKERGIVKFTHDGSKLERKGFQQEVWNDIWSECLFDLE